ncbi:MAG: two-component regulator propeller domain-containing protein [Acidobacteriota bacterium]
MRWAGDPWRQMEESSIPRRSPLPVSQPPVSQPPFSQTLTWRCLGIEGGVDAVAEDALGFLWLDTGRGPKRFDGMRVVAVGGTADAGVAGSGAALLARARTRHVAEVETIRETFAYLLEPLRRSAGLELGTALHDRRGTLWLGTRPHGLVRLVQDPPRPAGAGPLGAAPPVAADAPPRAQSIAELPARWRVAGAWSGRTEGAPRTESATATFHVLFEDSRELLWAGTDAGLCLLDPHRRAGRPAPPLDREVQASALAQGAEGRLWLGTSRGMIHLWDLADAAWRPDTVRLAGASPIRALLEDRAGRLWIGTASGLFLSRNRGRPRALAADDPSLGRIDALYQDRRGRVWVGGPRGVWVVPPADRLESVPRLETPARLEAVRSVRAFTEDDGGVVWVGTAGRGVVLVPPDPTSAPRWLDRAAGLGSAVVTGLRRDARGGVWVGTLAGAERWGWRGAAPGRLHDAVLGERTMALAPSAGGSTVWILGSRSMVEVDVDRADRAVVRHETLHRALGSVADAVVGPRGRLVLATSRGLFHLEPRALWRAPGPPSPVVGRLAVDGVPVIEPRLDAAVAGDAASARLRLAAGSSITFEVSAAEFIAPDAVRYAYRLGTETAPWIDVGAAAPHVEIAALAPGAHRLWVRARRFAGPWVERAAPIELDVEARGWRGGSTWWTYGLLGVVCLAAYVELQRRRVARQRSRNQALREADREKDRFLESTSYELRSPLVAVTTLAESLLDTRSRSPDDGVRVNLARIAAIGRQISRQVDEILDFSRLRHGTLRLRPQRLDFRSLVDVVLTRLGALVPDGVRLVQSIPPSLPPVRGDEQKLQQVLQMLVLQALETTWDGVVEVAAQATGGQLQVRISDTGIGFEAAELERLFQPFVGTSLGLLVTKELIQLQGGELSVESLADSGTTYTFSLPLDGAEAAGAGERATSVGLQETSGIVGLPRPTDDAGGLIYAVDDDVTEQQRLKRYLVERGHEVELFASGEELMTALDDSTVTPDLVLLDVMMPGLSGFEVCTRLRLRFSRHELPVIFLSDQHGDDAAVALSIGGNDSIDKPVSRAELLARVQLHLEWVSAYRSQQAKLGTTSDQVAALHDLLPLCPACGRIRNARGAWETIDAFVESAIQEGLDDPVCDRCVVESATGEAGNGSGDGSGDVLGGVSGDGPDDRSGDGSDNRSSDG